MFFKVPLCLSYLRPARRGSRAAFHPNAYWVVKDRFLAGAYPGDMAAGVARHKIGRFLAAGINSFVDLTEPQEVLPYAGMFGQADVEYRRFPIADHAVPADPRQMAEILDAIDAALGAGRKVYVHCQGGVGRTGTVVACWLQRHGRSPARALREVNRRWRTTARSRQVRSSPDQPAQVAWVREWAAQAARLGVAR